MRARHIALLPLIVAALLTGCGGADDPELRAVDPDRGGQDPGPGGLPPELQIPSSVPTTPDGEPVGAQEERVIRLWTDRLRRGDVTSAARMFDLPTKFQNLTPVLTVTTPEERIAVTQSLTCGARITKLESAGDYVITSFELVDRPGADCGGGAGGMAQSIIRTQDNKLVEWYRVIEGPDGEPQQPPLDPGTAV